MYSSAIRRIRLALAAAGVCALLTAGCGSSPSTPAQVDATGSVDTATKADAPDTSGVAPDTSDVATDAKPATTTTCPAGPCGNAKCEANESPASCNDCAKADLDCLEVPCATEWQACNAKPGCSNLAQCLQNCGGTSLCAAACAQSMGTVGVAGVWEPLAACSAKQGCGKNCGNGTCDPRETTGNCPADCSQPLASNGVCEPGEGPTTLCNRDCGLVDFWGCLASACPSQWQACQGDATCATALTCLQKCSPYDNSGKCVSACLASSGGQPSGALKALYTCPGSHECKPDLQAVCGDGHCHGESQVCPRDCGPAAGSCGDGKCQWGEKTNLCPADCKPIAPFLACAAALCPTSFAACDAAPGCHTMLQCMDKCSVAGNSACVDTCLAEVKMADVWTAYLVLQCAKDFHCQFDAPAGCGDGKCTPPETEADCPQDCFEPKVCGDNWCASTETKVSCPADCATCEDTGCGGKPGLVCCKVSGKPTCTAQSQCDAK